MLEQKVEYTLTDLYQPGRDQAEVARTRTWHPGVAVQFINGGAIVRTAFGAFITVPLDQIRGI